MHFGMDQYIVNPKELGTYDQLAYEKLVAFIEIFSPDRCMDIEQKFLLNEEGESVYEARLINMKRLLEFHSDEEALGVLGS